MANGQEQISALALDAETDLHARKSLDDVHAALATAGRRLVEISAAERENERRNRLAKEETARAVGVKARKEANRFIKARIEAAKAVDDAIVDLEAALIAYDASLPPLIEQFAIAEGPDRARELKATLDRRLRQSVRLAIWKAAPGLASLLHVERDGTAHWAPLQRLAEMLPGPMSDTSN